MPEPVLSEAKEHRAHDRRHAPDRLYLHRAEAGQQRVDVLWGSLLRWSAIGRFAQPDSIIADLYNPQSLNRYSYGLNNPLRYKDRSGHIPIDWLIDFFSVAFDIQQFAAEPSWENAGWLAADLVLGVVPYVPAAAGPLAKGAKLAGAVDKSADVVKAASKVDDAAKAGQALTKAAKLGDDLIAAKQLLKEAGKEGKVVVIGRTMNPRVERLGKEFGSKTFQPTAGRTGEQLWKENAEWLQKMMDEGNVIIDIGGDASRGPLKPGQIDYYARESKLMKDTDYKNLIDLSDVVPDSAEFDEIMELLDELLQ